MTDGLNALPANDQVICTLFEGDYHLGLAVLINSIVRGGFRGLFWAGYRGKLPPWISQLTLREDGLYQVGEATLGFEALEVNGHFAQFKADYLDSIFERKIATEALWYFDPDITVRCNWEFYERWVRFGVCLCQEITLGTMPSNHPIRCEWIELAQRRGWPEPVHLEERYYNSGFLALEVEHRDFLATWAAAMRLANAEGVKNDRIQDGTRANTFYSTDQDALNVAAMYTPKPLSTMGPEAMGFMTGGFTMYHTVGSKKPWRKPFLRSALSGDPPWRGDKHFLECADGPIWPYDAGQLKSMRRAANWGTLIGRFYRRQ